jgi:hypothetical protein
MAAPSVGALWGAGPAALPLCWKAETDEEGTMRAVTNDGGIRTVDVEEPRGDGVRVSVVAAGICGTDIGFVRAGYSGFVYGHEFAATPTTGGECS